MAGMPFPAQRVDRRGGRRVRWRDGSATWNSFAKEGETDVRATASNDVATNAMDLAGHDEFWQNRYRQSSVRGGLSREFRLSSESEGMVGQFNSSPIFRLEARE